MAARMVSEEIVGWLSASGAGGGRALGAANQGSAV